MKIAKRILAIAISVVLSVSVFSICASAEGTASGDEYMTVTVTTDKENYAPNEIVKVSVSVANNYNATSLRFPVMFDSDVFELQAITGLTAYNTCLSSGTISSNAENDGTYIPSNYSASDFGCFLVQWTASIIGGSVGCVNNPDGEVCFSFNLKAKSSAVGMTGTIFIPSESNLLYYQAINTPTDATTIYNMTAETCAMTFVSANASVVGEDVALVSIDDYGYYAVVDEEKLYVYGFNQGLTGNADIKQYVAATGGATIRSTSTEYGFGTGTAINLQVNTQTVKTYKVIIFGDINGDCIVDSIDASGVSAYVNALATIPSEEVRFAADVYEDGVLDSIDGSYVSSASMALTEMDQRSAA